MWYQITEQFSVNGGYSYFSNTINQDVTLGYRYDVASQTETSPWGYQGKAHVVSLNGKYDLTDVVHLMAGYEYVQGSYVINNVAPSPSGADWSQIPVYTAVIAQTQRWTTGLDWDPWARTNLYFRYVYFDDNDVSGNLTSGTSNMFLAGGTRVW